MTTPAILRRRKDRDSDRLATALFVAALLHGLLILGLKFTVPPATDDSLPTLEVLLVPPGPDVPSESTDAAYIAQRTQSGFGLGTDPKRASLPEAREERLPPLDAIRPDPDKRRRQNEPEGDVSVLASRTMQARSPAAGAEPQVKAPVFWAVPIPAVPTVGLNAAVADRELNLRGPRSVDDKLLADTRESSIATYLDGWKRRIERVGTINFPNEARRRQLSGNPVVEVEILADGSLESVTVRRSSGHAELDNAAVGIVRLAAPFEPFSGALRERFAVLRFAYEWQFINGQLGGDGAVFSLDP